MSPTKYDSFPDGLKLSREDEYGIVHRFAGTIRFPTVSAPEGFSLEPFHNMRQYSTTAWRNVFSSLDMELHGEASILLKWPGDPSRSLDPVMLAAHQDVVPAGDPARWSHDPWRGEIFKNRVWGRGTIDYKCGFAGMLEAVSLLLAVGFKPARTVYLSFGHDEEIGGLLGAKAITESLQDRNILCSSVLDEGGYIYSDPHGALIAEVAIAEKGYASFQLSAEAVQGHSSVPPDRTAIGILARAIVALNESSMPLPEVPEEIKSAGWLQTTFAPTIISGGCKENILPGRAEVIINTRPSPGSSVDAVLEHILTVVEPLGVKVELLDNGSVSEPSFVSSTDTKDFRALKRSILNVVSADTGFRCGVFPAATDSRRYSRVAKNAYRFMPVHLDQKGIGALHSVDESISTADYLRCVKFYAQYIQRTCR